MLILVTGVALLDGNYFKNIHFDVNACVIVNQTHNFLFLGIMLCSCETDL